MNESLANDLNLSGELAVEPGQDPGGATPPRPENPPPPTFWPFVTAVGLTVCFWGITLNLLIVLVGLGVFAIGMAGLLGDWIREHRNEST